MERPSEACPLPSGDDERIRKMLGSPCTVAVVGMSPKPDRPSNEVGLYLHQHGFDVVPVHPKAEKIGGLKVYPSLEAIPDHIKVEIVDLFVSGERTLKAVEEAGRINAGCVWFQPGTENEEYEARAAELGLDVVSGRCTKADHQRLFGGV